MKKIGLIVPYFGKLPGNFQIWLNSCKCNPSIHWLLFTDDKSQYDYPENVRVTYMSFKELMERFQKHFDFAISLESSYKLTDYKVAYGEIFQDFITEYDFWGYCDIDLIFGNIRKFITDEILNSYDKILSRGHLTLFRNTKAINALYRHILGDILPYQEVFTQPQHFYFDEWGKNGINQIFKSLDLPMYDEVVFHDVFHRKYKFIPSQLMHKKEYQVPNIYYWDRGSLYRYYNSKSNGMEREEIMYVHFLRRKMDTIYQEEHADRVLMVPNKFMTISYEMNNEKASRLLGSGLLDRDFVRFYYQNIKRKLKLKKK